jgi:hypothetical protein
MQQLRIHAIPLADDDGKRKYTFSLDNLTKGVARANQALAHADVELVFDPTWDWQPRNDTKLNNENNSGANWWVYGNQIASSYPGKIVISFRHGPGATPVGWGPRLSAQYRPDSASHRPAAHRRCEVCFAAQCQQLGHARQR